MSGYFRELEKEASELLSREPTGSTASRGKDVLDRIHELKRDFKEVHEYFSNESMKLSKMFNNDMEAQNKARPSVDWLNDLARTTRELNEAYDKIKANQEMVLEIQSDIETYEEQAIKNQMAGILKMENNALEMLLKKKKMSDIKE